MKKLSPQKPSKSSSFTFTVEGKLITFSGDFDSGNLQKVEQYYGSSKQYRLTPNYDHPTQQCSSKTFFHFMVSGFQSTRVRFRITNVSILSSIIKSQKLHLYRPVYKTNLMGEYERIATPVKSNNNYDKLEIMFEYVFAKEEYVYFAFAYPYSYHRSREFSWGLGKELEGHEEIYFHRQTLVLSNMEREVELITVTNRGNCLKEREEGIEGLFPYFHDKRPFKIDSIPKVLITARVHPGESTSSYCFEGLLKFLTDKNDYRAYLLRKKFHFILIPMLNPDGVYQGNYRWDPASKQDLNRVYTKCTQKQQPTIWAVKEYIEKVLKRVDFYFDLHGHASLKHFFVYGNSFDNVIHQTQTELFSRVLSINSNYFAVDECNFNREDQDTKSGCARFYLMKKYRIIHSYTVECAFHSPEIFNELVVPKNEGIIYDGVYKMGEESGVKLSHYSIEDYMNMGKAVLVSILDIIKCNPYSRVGTAPLPTLQDMRKEIANELYKRQDRLRISDPFITKNIKNIDELCSKYYSNILKQTTKLLPKTKIKIKSSSPYVNKITAGEECRKSHIISQSVNVKSLSAHSIKQLQIQTYRKMPSVTQSTTKTNQAVVFSNIRFSSKLPNKTVETQRLIARMKKVQENKNQQRREADSLKLLPIRQSQYLLQLIQQRLDTSTRIHKGYVPFSLPTIKVKQKLKRESLKYVKRNPNASPSQI